MFIYYNEQGRIIGMVWGVDKIRRESDPSVEIDEIQENKGLITDLSRRYAMNEPGYTVLNGKLHFNGVESVVAVDADKSQIRAEYQQTIDQLTTIENTVNPTNAQVIAAVKYLAKTLRLLLKIIARLVT